MVDPVKFLLIGGKGQSVIHGKQKKLIPNYANVFTTTYTNKNLLPATTRASQNPFCFHASKGSNRNIFMVGVVGKVDLIS